MNGYSIDTTEMTLTLATVSSLADTYGRAAADLARVREEGPGALAHSPATSAALARVVGGALAPCLNAAHSHTVAAAASVGEAVASYRDGDLAMANNAQESLRCTP